MGDKTIRWRSFTKLPARLRQAGSGIILLACLHQGGTGFKSLASEPDQKIGLPANFKPSRRTAVPYFQEATVGAYRKIGARNPKWDTNAEVALTLYGYQLCDEGSVVCGPESRRMRNAIELALRAGCDDPLVLYVALRIDQLELVPFVREAPWRVYSRMITNLATHPYPPLRVGYIYVRAAEAIGNVTESQLTAEMKERGAAWLKTAAAKAAEIEFREIDPEDFYLWCTRLTDVALKTTGDRKQGYDLIAAALQKNPSATGAIPLCAKGDFYVTWAWDGRGTGFADTLTEEQWTLFRERLAVARQALEEAWSKNPSDARICQRMISVAAGECRPEEIQTWFQRGRKINPGYGGYYVAALHYLQPKWLGSEQAMLDLAHQCVKEGLWAERIPLVMVNAHKLIAEGRAADPAPYFREPGVWEEIEPVFQQYLARFPDDYGQKSSYAYFAALAGKWDIANRLLDELGSNVVPASFEGRGRYMTYRDQIRKHASSK